MRSLGSELDENVRIRFNDIEAISDDGMEQVIECNKKKKRKKRVRISSPPIIV